MPTDFGEIAHYNKRIAARFFLRAQIARNNGRRSEAEYHAQLALRYIEAAREQRVAMCQEPGHSANKKNSHRRPWALLPAPQSATRRLAASIWQLVARRSVPIQSLSLN